MTRWKKIPNQPVWGGWAVPLLPTVRSKPARRRAFAAWAVLMLAGTAVAYVACGVSHKVLVGTAWVHDGDTMSVAGQAVRLRGIDAEELSEPHGEAAGIALRAIVGDRLVSCTVTGRSYKRVVGVCRLPDGTDIQAAMVRGGYALDCARYSGGRYRSIEPPGIRSTLSQKPYCDRRDR